MKTLSKALALTLVLITAGCNKSDEIDGLDRAKRLVEIDRLTEGYRLSSDEQDGYNAFESLMLFVVDEVGSKDEAWYEYSLRKFLAHKQSEKERQLLADLRSIALSNQHYKLFTDIYVWYFSEPTDGEASILSDNYTGTSAHLNNAIARWHIKNNRVRSAFRRLEVAALAGSYAQSIDAQNTVRYMLEKYGCIDTASIWAELSDGQYKSMSQYDVGGDKYPAIPATLSREEVVDLRVKLRNGSPPELQSDCPIHKYS